MILNTVKQSKVLHPYCAQDTMIEMHGKIYNTSDCFTVFDIMPYSSLFQSFLMCYSP